MTGSITCTGNAISAVTLRTETVVARGCVVTRGIPVTVIAAHVRAFIIVCEKVSRRQRI